MASDKNSPHKGQGNNQPDHKQSSETDAAAVDWMIISDISTRIGGSPPPKKESSQEQKNLSGTLASQTASNLNDDDSEDLEWLRSLDLDEPIERSVSPKTGSKSQSNSQSSNDVGNIDWLIVSDLKTRMDDSEIKSKVDSDYKDIAPSNPTFQPPSVTDNFTNNTDNLIDDDLGLNDLNDDLNLDDLDLDDLGLDSLNFNENSDFSDLDSLNFDTQSDFNINELLNESDNPEDKIQGLSGFLDDNFDSDNDLNDNNWDRNSEIPEDINDQFSEQSSLNIINESFEISPQNFEVDSTIKDYYDNADVVTDQLSSTEYQEDLVDDLEVFSEVQTLESVEEFSVSNEFQDAFQNNQDAFLSTDISEDLPEELGNKLEDDGFGEVQTLESFDPSVIVNDEIWSSAPSLESEISNVSENDAFADNWEQIAEDAINDPIWDSPASFDADAISSTSIDNAFGSLDDWAIASPTEQLDLVENAELKFPIDEPIEQDSTGGINIDSEQIVEQTNTQLEAEEITEKSLDLSDNLIDENDESWAIADSLIENMEDAEDIDFDDNQVYDDFENTSNNLDNAENIIDQSPQFEELASPSLSPPLSDWESYSDSFSEQITDKQIADSEFANNLPSYDLEPKDPNLNTQVLTDWETNEDPLTDNFDDLESILDENFDLEAFEQDQFLKTPVSNDISENIATTLTQNRLSAIPEPEDPFTSEFASVPLSSDGSVNDLIPPSDPFEDDLANDLINDSHTLEVDGLEEVLENDLLDRYASESDGLDDFVSERGTPAPLASNLGSSTNFDINPSDRDFLDEFDLDSIDSQLIGDEFDSGFSPSAISTGLNPSPPPIAPTAPSISQSESTSLPINNPPPPPFLPPLPPRRSSSQSSKVAPSPSSVPNATFPSPPPKTSGEKIELDNFDDFSTQPTQNKNRNSINSIDESWSELLDADTVLSGALRSPTGSPYSGNNPPPTGSTRGRTSQGKQRSASQSSSRQEPGLDDFDDLGLETYNDDNDWSGLLDSGNLSDSLSSISTQMPSQVNRKETISSRLDATSISETREIPRDRRNPTASFGDAAQAHMSEPADQMDFNRFTKDNYDSNYDPETASKKPSKPKVTIPNVSLESLWQDYLKIPVIGLGAIGGAFLLYALLNRPVFDLGLRWGIFKDASGKNFTNADFKGAKLDKVDFSKAILTGAKMQDASLVGANFQEANLDGVNFTKANLNGARLIQASVIWAEFQNAQLNLADLAGADLRRSSFNNAKMEGTNLKGSKIGAQGTEEATKFSAVTLLTWQIVNDPREGRNLIGQNLSGLNLSFSNLKRANLTNAKLNYTDMTEADLSGANLTRGQVNGVNWSGAKLNGINLTGVVFDKNKLPKTDAKTVCPNNQKGPCKF